MHGVLARQLRKLAIGDGPPDAEQWRRFLERVDCAYAAADQDRYTLERALELSSAEMRKRFAELREAQGKLVQASRKAGMADVATSVLHNVGNVLNSVNVSANIVGGLLKASARTGLGKSLALLSAQAAPGKFIDEDPRGKKLIPYLTAVDRSLGEERDAMLRETESLARNIEHIKCIVGQQLAGARGDTRGAKIVERVTLEELFDDAADVLQSTLATGQHVKLVREPGAVAIATDRHKVFQIVMNLLANARDAVAARPGAGCVTLRALRLPDQRVAIEVEDDGIGIPEDTLARIFSHGFTTKNDGHGFGLHSSACAAGELGGSLAARSGGFARGATFTLLLPAAANQESAG